MTPRPSKCLQLFVDGESGMGNWTDDDGHWPALSICDGDFVIFRLPHLENLMLYFTVMPQH